MFTLIVSLLLISGCGNARLFNIAQRVEVAPENFCCKTNVGDLFLAADPLTDEDKILATFDGNLLLAGILPIRTLIENRSGAAVDSKRAQFVLVDSSGHQYKELDPKQALKQMVKYYGIQYQRKGSFEKTLTDLNAVSFLKQPPLAASETRQGFVYFAIDATRGVPQGLKLLVKRLRQGNEKKDIDATLALTR